MADDPDSYSTARLRKTIQVTYAVDGVWSTGKYHIFVVDLTFVNQVVFPKEFPRPDILADKINVCFVPFAYHFLYEQQNDEHYDSLDVERQKQIDGIEVGKEEGREEQPNHKDAPISALD